MAVIKPQKKPNKHGLKALTAAALSLPGVGCADGLNDMLDDFPIHSPAADYQYMHYEEGGNRMKADVHHGALSVSLYDRLKVTASFDVDIYSGATPEFSTPDAVTDVVTRASSVAFAVSAGELLDNPSVVAARQQAFARGEDGLKAELEAVRSLLERPIPSNFKTNEVLADHPEELRKSVNLSIEYELDDNLTYTLSGGHSSEPDYKSSFVSIGANYELNQKLTNISGGFGYTLDKVSSVSRSDVSEKKDDQIYRLGLTQILGKNTLASIGTSYTRRSGFLSNPYKIVYIRGLIQAEDYIDGFFNGGIATPKQAREELEIQDLEIAGVDLFFERRPKVRNEWVFAPKLVQYVPKLDGSLHLGYRYYSDNWKIDSHTFDIKWYQPFSGGWLISPRFRYYSQSKAKFFRPFFLNPRKDGNYSSDFRLSGYGTISTGLQLEKSILDQVALNAGAEWTTHKGNLQLGGNNLKNASYADIDYFTVTVGVNIKF
ncbi:MAG: DUF3570 domain-containing protein [Methylococcales bacterium]